MATINKKFVTKHGLNTQNIDLVSPDGLNTIQVTMLDTDTLSFSGDSGQLFSITDSLSGTIFAVNDISGVPSIEVDDDGTIRFAETTGNILIGTATDDGTNKLQVNGNVDVAGDVNIDGGDVLFEGTSFTTTLTYTEPTAARTVTFQDASGTVAYLSDITGGGSGTFSDLEITSSIIFEGSTVDANETTLVVVDPTADRTVTFQDASGTVALLGTIALGTDTTGAYVADITAGTGISLSETANGAENNTVTINHSNSITAGTASEGGATRTLAYGGTFNVPSVTYDAQGHITATGSVTLTLPIADDTDTTYDLTVPTSTTAIRLAGSDATNDDITITGGTNVTVTRTSATELTIASTDTNTTYTAGTGLTLNGTTIDANVEGTTQTTAANAVTTTSSRTYAVQVDGSDNLVVNVPWSDTNTNTNTTYDLTVPTSTTAIRLAGSDATNDDITITGGTNVTVTRTSATELTIASTDTNTNQLTTFTLTADSGTNQTIAHNDTLDIAGGTYVSTVVGATDTVTVNHANTTRNDTTSTDAPAYGGTFEAVTSVTTNATGHVTAIDVSTVTIPASDNTDTTGINIVGASSTATADSTATNGNVWLNHIEGGSVVSNHNITGSGATSVTSDASGNITISSTDTTYSKATSTTLGLVKLEDNTVQTTAANAVTTTASRTYGVQLNASDQLVVNVPWSDTNTNTTYSAGTGLTLNGTTFDANVEGTTQTTAANAVTTTASRTYAVQVDGSDNLVVNVPWSDTNTNTDTLQSIAADATNATRYITFVNSTSGAQTGGVDTALTFNPSSNLLSNTGDIVAGSGSGGVALTINDGQGNANVTFNHADGSAEQAGNVGRITVNTDSTTGAYMDFDVTSNASAGAVTSVTYMRLNESSLAVTGDITATADVTAYFSDERLKDFHGKIQSPLDKLSKLNGYYFTENETAKEIGFKNEKIQVGVSAQEVEAVLPEVVVDAPINNEENGYDFKTVKYDKMVPLLIEAIKEQQTMIDELKSEIENLKNKS